MKFSFVADHFQYLACIAPIAVAAAIIGRASIGVPIVLLLGIITWNYSRAFADSETLWRDVIAKNPDSLIAHSNLANEYLKQGKLNEAESEWAAAFRLDPHFTDARIGLGLVAEARGDQFMAEQDYRNAIIDDPANPRAYWYLGLWDRKNNQTDDALVQFREAAKFFPNPAAALEQIGEIDLKSGEPVQAETEFRLALQSDPDLLDAHVNLASVYLSSDPPNLAIARSECQIAIEIDPTSAAAWNDLGIANIEDRQLEMAISDFKKALECDPEFAMARTNLAKLGQH
jgi:tetratricopeptide (TPR) repeat protein